MREEDRIDEAAPARRAEVRDARRALRLLGAFLVAAVAGAGSAWGWPAALLSGLATLGGMVMAGGYLCTFPDVAYRVRRAMRRHGRLPGGPPR